jgi:hypothetical protein
MPEPQHALLKVPASPLSDRPPQQSLVRIDGELYQMQLLSQPQPQPIRQEATAPSPTHYQTAKSRGLPAQPINLPKLPSILTLTLSTVIALSFLVAASMFSISLTAYSNSLERIDRSRSFMLVE